MAELHAEASFLGFGEILEVSTKSDSELGRRLSAFRLDVELSGISSKIECIYQASKVFEKGGPFEEIVHLSPLEAKRYFKARKLGLIKCFSFKGQRYENLPFHAFYDWLFLRALAEHKLFLSERLSRFDAFSDIEFNPSKSINTQARSVAIIATLIKRDQLDACASDFDFFRAHLEKIEKKTSTQIQLGLGSFEAEKSKK
nr:hypothetical protein [Hyphomonas jannaschiana]